jgi:hypothetical protein
MTCTLLRRTSHFSFNAENNFTFQFSSNQSMLFSDKQSHLVFLHCSSCSTIKHFGDHVDKQACLHHTYQRKTIFTILFQNYLFLTNPLVVQSVSTTPQTQKPSTENDPEPISSTSHPYYSKMWLIQNSMATPSNSLFCIFKNLYNSKFLKNS